MKIFLCFVPIFALLFASCSSPNNTTVVNNAATPTIVGFSPDTVWTFDTLTIFGTHFGFDPADVNVTIDTTPLWWQPMVDDTILRAIVPEGAEKGLIHVATINGSIASAKPVVIKYTFYPHTINDTLPIGASFSIPGTGMNNYHGSLQLSVSGIAYPIDSVFPDRIVSHVVPNAKSGTLILSDSVETLNVGTLSITRPSAWKTLSEIWDNLSVTETHRLSRYANNTMISDSTWQTMENFSGQSDINISGSTFIRTPIGLQYNLSVPSLLLTWDTVHQTASIQFQTGVSKNSGTLIFDSIWGATASNVPAALPVDNDIEFIMPSFGLQITEESLYSQSVVWVETTSFSSISGSFDLIFKK